METRQKSIPGPREGVALFSFELPAEMYTGLAERAAAEDRSIAWIVRQAISQFLAPIDTRHAGDSSGTLNSRGKLRNGKEVA